MNPPAAPAAAGRAERAARQTARLGGHRRADQPVAAPNKPLTRDDVMAAFGEKAFLMLRVGPQMAGVLGWQVENLVARTVDIILAPEVAPAECCPP